MTHDRGAEPCTRVRALLRDRADGELAPDDRQLVDDHVHGCASCSNALTRAEFEVLVLRRALEEDAAAARVPPPDLAARVRARVSDEAQIGPSPEFTRVVMERVSKEYRPRRPALPWRGRAGLLAAALVVCVAALAVVASRRGRPEAVARVVTAVGPVEVGHEGAPPVAAIPGMQLRSGARLRSSAEADAVVDLEPGAGARIAWRDQGEVELWADRVVLRDGALRIDARGELRLEGLADASARLAPGSYDVRVAPRRRFDGSLSVEPLLGVRLEVLEGRATIERRGAQTVVDGGSVAHFGHWQAIEVEAGLSPELLRASQRRGLVATAGVVDAPARRWRGRVVDARSGLGVRGAQVRLDAGDGPLALSCDEDGSFMLPATGASLGVVEIVPPDGSGLAPIARRPIRLPAAGGPLETLVLEAGWRLAGSVRDAAGVPLAAARIVPCVVDEVFGRCERREDLRATSLADGSFRLSGLPAQLGPRQALALVVEHRAHPTTAVARLDPAGQATLDVRMHAPRELELAGLPALRRVEIAQSVPGLAASVFVVRTEVVTDASGSALLHAAGPGRLWMQERATGRAVALAADAELGPEILRPADGERSGSELALAERPGTRYASYRARPPVPTGYLTVLDGGSVLVPGTCLFLISGGEIEFLGEFTGLESFPFAAPDGEFAIVAVGPDGSFGWRDGAELAAGAGEIRVLPPGAVELDVPEADLELVRAAHVRFRMVDGPLAGQEFVREVRIEDRARVDDLLPGAYVIEFEDGSRVEVDVESDGSVQVGLPVGVLGR